MYVRVCELCAHMYARVYMCVHVCVHMCVCVSLEELSKREQMKKK